jgi:mono/diheme cytochrome c family protein
MIHLSELHGAATHLAVVAIPLFAILYACRRAGIGGTAMEHAESYALYACAIGVLAAGVTGLLVWGQAQTTLRGQDFRVGTAHFWIGIGVAVLVAIPAIAHAHAHWRGLRRPAPLLFGAIAILATAGALVQGYLGGRMTYAHAVGIDQGGELTQSAVGAQRLNLELAQHVPDARAGQEAFGASGLGCARCHGDQAQGERGPQLAGGVDLTDFRRVHEHGLFPKQIVTDRDFAAVNAWLRTLKRTGGGKGGD